MENTPSRTARRETAEEKLKREIRERDANRHTRSLRRNANTKKQAEAVERNLKYMTNSTAKTKALINAKKAARNAARNATRNAASKSGDISSILRRDITSNPMSNNELKRQMNALQTSQELQEKEEELKQYIKTNFQPIINMFYDKACKLKLKDIILGINFTIRSYIKLCLKIKDSYGYENPYDKPLKIINKEEIDEIKTMIEFSNEKIDDDEIRNNVCNNIKLIQKIVELLIEKLNEITDTRTNNNNRLYNADINNYLDSIHKILHYLKNEYEVMNNELFNEKITLQLNPLIKNIKEWINKCNDEVDTRYLNNNESKNNNKNKVRDTKILEFSDYTQNYISILNEIVKLEISKELIPPEKYITSMKNDLDKQMMLYRKSKGIKNNNKNAYKPYNMCIFVTWLLDQMILLERFIIQNNLFDSKHNFIYLYNIKLLFEYINDNLSKYQTDKNYERFNNKMKNTRKLKKIYN
jgi:hypothetical protein